MEGRKELEKDIRKKGMNRGDVDRVDRVKRRNK